jgi:hypothetical protein
MHLLILHCLAVVLHVLSGALGSVVITSTSRVSDVSLVAPYFEYITGQSDSGIFLKSIPQTVGSVSILWPAVAVEFITAFFHIVYIVLLYSKSADRISRRFIANTPSLNPLRWIEYGITATLMSSFSILAIGISDVYLFLKVIVTGVALQSIGYILEIVSGLDIGKDDAKLTMIKHRLFTILFWFVGFLLNFGNVIIMLWQTFGSTLHDAQILYIANSIPFALWFQTFGIVARFDFKKNWQFQDRYFTEKYYIILSLSTKIAVFWLSESTFRQILRGIKSNCYKAWSQLGSCSILFNDTSSLVVDWIRHL